MDATYFLKNRTVFLRTFYSTGAQGFVDVKQKIETGQPPFDDPPYSEDPEPAYLAEWMEAATALEALGMAALSMLSDSLKLYLNTLADRVIGFSFDNSRSAFKQGFLSAYFSALGEILETDWSDCPVDRDLIEQVVLVRNRGQHSEHLSTFAVTLDAAMFEKHPRPFFISEDELSTLIAEDGSLSSMLMPTIRVTAVGLQTAIDEVDALADWIEDRLDRAHAWRLRKRSESEAGT
ncbi:MAG: hypothetical protein ABJA20_11505 [Novosphingobium sp.]